MLVVNDGFKFTRCSDSSILTKELNLYINNGGTVGEFVGYLRNKMSPVQGS